MAAYSHGRDTDALSATISLQQLTDQLDALEAEAAVEIPGGRRCRRSRAASRWIAG